MAAPALRGQLNALLDSMFATGIVDEAFQHLRSVEQEGFLAEVVNLFLHDADNILNEVAFRLNQPMVNFDSVGALVHQLKGCSGSVGAKKMNLSCTHFRQFYEAQSKEGCLMSLDLIRNEFYDVRNKLQTMIQLEQQIAAMGPQ
ncbi:histidine-containing phosphotransfer protein 2-like [Triticum dicoccoides]|uniref:histidine-containing phosphotransfer protein 2-like n=1 Tax=Triticum dicoccoides TaxID=85692 RepID=UPI00188F971E|nr:histidine-containing phosphotransfer protein 2-like [Triticum dicoccoides]